MNLMKIFHYSKVEDFGVEYVFTLFKGKRRSFLQVSFDWYDYASFPYLAISLGNNRLFDFLFSCWKVGFSFALFDNTWGSWK
jgi:hypothetical protein